MQKKYEYSLLIIVDAPFSLDQLASNTGHLCIIYGGDTEWIRWGAKPVPFWIAVSRIDKTVKLKAVDCLFFAFCSDHSSESHQETFARFALQVGFNMASALFLENLFNFNEDARLFHFSKLIVYGGSKETHGG